MESFRHRDNSKVADSVLRSISEQLDIDQDMSEKLLKQMAILLKKVLFESLNELAQIQSVFANSNLDANLVKLISKLVFEKLGTFKKTLTDSQSKKIYKEILGKRF